MLKDLLKVKFFAWTLICLFLCGGCRGIVKPLPEEAPPGIIYKIAPLAQMKKVTLYEGKDKLWWIDITLQNIAEKKQAFRVSVKVDDWAAVSSFTGAGKRAELEPQKEEIIKLQTLSKSIPRTLVIEVTPYP